MFFAFTQMSLASTAKQSRHLIESEIKSCITCASRCDQFGFAACTIAFCRVGCHGNRVRGLCLQLCDDHFLKWCRTLVGAHMVTNKGLMSGAASHRSGRNGNISTPWKHVAIRSLYTARLENQTFWVKIWSYYWHLHSQKSMNRIWFADHQGKTKNIIIRLLLWYCILHP